jgi:hypothetical protein
MSIYPLHYISETALSIKQASLYANAWDKRQSAILQAASLGQRDVVVKPINSLYSVMEAGNNDEFWVNICIASYYDIHTLIAK